MELQRILGHTIRKSGAAESTEIDIYGLVLHKWGVNTNIPFNPRTDYEYLLSDITTFVSSLITENIKELNQILSELTRLHKTIEVKFQANPYHYKLIIICTN